MNRFLRLASSIATLVTVGILPAVSQTTAPQMPVIVIQQVDAEDTDVYAMLLARNNETIKEKLGFENFFRVYLGVTAGEDTGAVFVVTAADSFATLSKNSTVVFADLELAARGDQLDAVRTLGPQTSWKAVRFQGAHVGASIYNAWVSVTDEPGYLAALDELRALLDARGLKDVHLNFYRAVAGRTNATHFVSFNAPSSEQLAAFLDVMATDEAIRLWIVASGKHRTLVRTGTYLEITK
ncbi:MAG TPA: hypothetical protein VIK52_01440 [Opitutaceae bacterium]